MLIFDHLTGLIQDFARFCLAHPHPGGESGLESCQNIPWQSLPLKRSLSRPIGPQSHSLASPHSNNQGAEPITYISALFPWLSAHLKGDATPPDGLTQTQHTREQLRQWQATRNPALPFDYYHVEIIPVSRREMADAAPASAPPSLTDPIADCPPDLRPPKALKITVSAVALDQQLRVWLQQSSYTPLPVSLISTLKHPTDYRCLLHYYRDRCENLRNLAQHQGWAPPTLDWGNFDWTLSLPTLLEEARSDRLLLEAWLDQIYALDHAPQRLKTALPQYLNTFEAFDRSHAIAGLWQTVNQHRFRTYLGLLELTARLLSFYQEQLNRVE